MTDLQTTITTTDDKRPSPGIPEHVAITGGTSGIGKALAMHYAKPGRLLSIIGRNETRLAQVARDCRDLGAVVDILQADVTNADAMHDWLHTRDDHQPIDLLIASAGMGGVDVVPPSSGEDGPLARQILSTNTFGVVNAVTPLLSRMTGRRSGHIVIVGSISGAIGLPQSPAYCASKAAVQVYGDALRRLIGQHGVRVTNVLPGFVDTPMSQSLDMARPFCWPAEKAARRIARDVARGARQSVFPWQLRTLIGLQKFLPLALSDFILTQTIKHGWESADPKAD